MSVTIMLAGLALVGSGLGGEAAYVLLAVGASETAFPLTVVTSVAGLASLSLGLGGTLIWQGVRTWRGEPDGLFHFPHPIGLGVLFVGAMAIGQGVLSFDLAPRLFFPPFQVLAGILPAAIILAFVGRRLSQVARQREIVGLLASGMLLAGPGAIVLVGMAGLALALFLTTLVVLTPGGLDTVQSLLLNIRDPAWLEDPNSVASLIFTPLGLAGLFLLVVIIGPLIEEMLKPVGVLLIRRRPKRAEAFLWGIAGASGFAMVEGVLNSAVDLDAWLAVASMRVGTSLMHCLAGGLVGLGWYFLWSARRPLQGIGLYLLAVVLHGTWNAVTLGIGGLAFVAPEIGDALAGLGLTVLLGTLGFLIVVALVALAWLVRRLRADLRGQADLEVALGPLEG
ncbi:MAG: PrsW family intramembrane metalloprotease [Anaerolineae bacterium]|nr:MAG: PrsW family intramembrane metalloprotease [Anaerolineae bacterium]